MSDLTENLRLILQKKNSSLETKHECRETLEVDRSTNALSQTQDLFKIFIPIQSTNKKSKTTTINNENENYFFLPAIGTRFQLGRFLFCV